jgi:hypothetical protein
LHTKPRAEKKVAQQLSDMGVTAYCPTVSKVSQWSDRKKNHPKTCASLYDTCKRYKL